MKNFLTTMLFFFSLTAHAVNSMTIDVQPSQITVKITLPANPTTGFQWSLKDYDQSLLTLESQRFEAPKTHLIGAGGVSIFTFKVLDHKPRPKSTQLTFKYARSWEPSSATQTVVSLIFLKNP